MIVAHSPSVVRVRESAVVGGFALIGGLPAWAVSSLLRNFPGGVEKALARNGVPPARVRDVLRAVEALELVAADWRTGAGAPSAPLLPSGNEERQFADSPARSDDMSADDAAVILQRTSRRVRQAAAMGELPGHRERGCWRFRREDVLRYLAERDGTTDHEKKGET